MTRVLIFGGRDWDNQALVDATLDRLHSEHGFTLVINGGQESYDRVTKRKWGADYQAAVWAKARGLRVIFYRVSKADWDKYGKPAGPRRNAQMLRDGRPELGIQIGKGGNGTADMRRRLDGAGVRVVEVGVG